MKLRDLESGHGGKKFPLVTHQRTRNIALAHHLAGYLPTITYAFTLLVIFLPC